MNADHLRAVSVLKDAGNDISMVVARLVPIQKASSYSEFIFLFWNLYLISVLRLLNAYGKKILTGSVI